MVELKYFKTTEFDSPDLKDSGENMDVKTVLMLDCLREKYGKPIIISSGFRTKEYNSKIGGAKNSWHLRGRAVDIPCTSLSDRFNLVKYALEIGFTGIEIADKHIHLDTRDTTPVIFTGKSK